MINKKNMLEEKKLTIKPLRISFIKKDFVSNFETNYETYLTDFINNSKFIEDNKNKKFTIIQKQSDGECDITNGEYSLDYKLLIDSKTIENMSYYSENLLLDKYGGVVSSLSKRSGTYKIYILLNILKGLSVEDIKEISITKKNKLDASQKLVKDYINKIKCNKNILYFIPYNLYFKNTIMDKNMLNYVADMLSEGLKGFLEYRTSHTNKDTYISFISNDNIVF